MALIRMGGGKRRFPRRVMPFNMDISSGRPTKPLPPAALDVYWHPERDGVEPAPEHIRQELARISDRLAIVRPPGNAPLTASRAYLVWYRKPSVTHRLCPGWSLMFDWRGRDGAPLPLDERVFANIWMASTRAKGEDRRELGSAIKYFESIVKDLQRKRASKEKTHQNDRRDHQRDMQDFWKIKNIGSGNKFALHHDGISASVGELLWRQQTARRRLPSEVLADAAEQRERRAAARG